MFKSLKAAKGAAASAAASSSSAAASSSSSSSSKAAAPLTPAQHLLAELQCSYPPADLLERLEQSRCRPLDAESEERLRAEAEAKEHEEESKTDAADRPSKRQKRMQGLDAEETKEEQQSSSSSSSSSSSAMAVPSASASATAAASSEAAAPASAPASVQIIDLSSSPAREVSTLSAFGLTWAPLRGDLSTSSAALDARAHTLASLAAEGSARSSAYSSVPFPLSSEVLPPVAVTAGSALLYSVESALFTAPPSNLLAVYEQQKRQLPSALASNAAALKAAEETGELAELGALYLERKRLQAELKRMHAAVPPNADVLEVRDTLTLPMNIPIPIDGHVYFLLPAAVKVAWEQSRHLAITDVHPCGRFNPPPFADSALGRSLAPHSKILTAGHTAGLMQVCGGKRPLLKKLLYQGSRDGFTAAQFHIMCDNQGPTLLLVRSQPPQSAVFGAYTAESWTSNSTQIPSDAFIFSFGPVTAPLLTKLIVNNPAQVMYGIPSCGPVLGPNGYALTLHANMRAVGNSSCAQGQHGSGFAPAPGFPG